MNPGSKSPSQMSSTTAGSYASNDYINQMNAQIVNYIQNSQLPELSQFITTRQVPPGILTQFLSGLIDNSQNIEIIKLFLSKGADVNTVIHSTALQIEESEGITLLMYSIIANNFSLFDVIMSFHPDILLTDSSNKNAVVYSILFNDDSNRFLLMKLLTENNNAIHTTVTSDNELHNLVSLATLKNKRNFVEVLLNTDVDVNYQTKPGMDTALHIAVKNDNVEIAELIYRNPKFNKEAKNAEGKTAKALAKEIKGKVYYNIFAREHETPSPQPQNIPNFTNNNNKENIAFNSNNNNFLGAIPNMNKNNSKKRTKIDKHKTNESISIPIDIVNEKCWSVISKIFY